jgi:predicted dehydrogenase
LNIKKNIGLLGSGFALYGYLPALINLGFKRIITLNKYKKKILQRADIRKYYCELSYCNNENELIKKSQTIIVCKRPSDQKRILNKIFKEKNKNVLLEKPLAKNIQLSKIILKKLINKKIKYNIFYSFLYTNWFRLIKKNYKKSNIEFNWSFYSYDLKNNINNWKLKESEGGGIINYYGIHFVSIAAHLGYKKILKSEISVNKKKIHTKWTCVFYKKKSKITIKLNINSSNNFFKIKKEKKIFFINNSPFAKTKESDDRIPILQKYINLKIKKKYLNNLNEDIITLLKNIKKVNKFLKNE